MTLKVGAMFAGYFGIELALSQVLDVELAWYAEFDPKASLIGAHHWPGVPNLGDVTKVDWCAAPRVDVVTGGSPCQDLSHAGARKGMTDGTRSNLWVEMREAIAVDRPRLVVWENVRGALSAVAHSDLEPCPGCVGDRRDGQPVLRALGRVLGDLADLGYDARWYGLRAADVGAPHGRFRIFLFATPATDAHHAGRRERGWPLAVRAQQPPAQHVGSDAALAPLLPTPAVNDMGACHTPDSWDEWTDRMKAAHGNGNGHGKSLAVEAQRLLPTPRATDGTKGGPNQRGSSGDLMLPSAVGRLLPTPNASDVSKHAGQPAHKREGHALRITDAVEYPQDWREYEPAIRRWEALTRPAPTPTEPGRNGRPRLSAPFVEWMMGLPSGHVTDVPGLSRNDQLKALGNGVVPQQCEAALRAFLHDTQEVAA